MCGFRKQPSRAAAEFPIQGEQPTTELVSGNYAWNLNGKASPYAVGGCRRDRNTSCWPTRSPSSRLAWRPECGGHRPVFGRENRTVKVVGFNVKSATGRNRDAPPADRRVQ